MQIEQLAQILEGILLASAERVPIVKLVELFQKEPGVNKAQIESAFEYLASACQHRSYQLRCVESGYYLQVKSEVSTWVCEFNQSAPKRPSKAFLETLAIIAHQQPVTRADIEAVRGVSVSPQVMKKLLDMELIKEAGCREVPGRPTLFKTTPQFLMHFNMTSLEQLREDMVSE